MPKKTKIIKPLNGNKATYKQPLQHNIVEAQKPDKIKPNEIFETNPKKSVSKSKKKILIIFIYETSRTIFGNLVSHQF